MMLRFVVEAISLSVLASPFLTIAHLIYLCTCLCSAESIWRRGGTAFPPAEVGWSDWMAKLREAGQGITKRGWRILMGWDGMVRAGHDGRGGCQARSVHSASAGNAVGALNSCINHTAAKVPPAGGGCMLTRSASALCPLALPRVFASVRVDG
ncbi:hypothetical protein CALCODRAFT_9344 [Calocera cornea HHB12733]|uniref:Uncharacterized protein n=1 Tax=Calocera cornea HHB12733 TaxID=1353952 RepID=A0A165J5N3_9BASI|nr:hypothetical protein CALCODRAFT_9344 [Calocera cornea HHB12733]